MGDMRSLSTQARWFALCAGVLAFWWVRGAYWSVTEELPFSDMADFERIARHLLEGGGFGHTEFFQSFKPPVQPLLGAAVFGVFGLENYLAWRLCQALLIFGGLIWFLVELNRVTGKPWISVVLLWSVALSKASVFWSFKFATEGVAEAFLYMSVAVLLRAFRTRARVDFLLLGVLAALGALHRPNFVGCTVACGLAILCLRRYRIGGLKIRAGRRARWVSAAVFALGGVLAFGPWALRGYQLYGTPLLTNTSGGYTWIFDLGPVTLTEDDGTVVTKSHNELLREAPTHFPNDYEAQRYAFRFFAEWFREDPQRYFDVLLIRARMTLNEHTVYLTKVSRTDLIAEPWNAMLIDKSPLLLLGGLLGLALLCLRESAVLSVLPAAIVSSWFLAILVANTSRYLDPVLPLLLGGNAVLAGYLLQATIRFNARRRGIGQPSGPAATRGAPEES